MFRCNSTGLFFIHISVCTMYKFPAASDRASICFPRQQERQHLLLVASDKLRSSEDSPLLKYVLVGKLSLILDDMKVTWCRPRVGMI